MKTKNRMRIRKWALLLAVMLISMSVLTACGIQENTVTRRYDLDVVEATPDFYINDFAGVFTEEQKAELMAKAVEFDKEYSGVQVVITTVEYLNDAVLGYEVVVENSDGNATADTQAANTAEPKFTIEEIAYSMYSQYGIGQDDMGILILFSTADREVRIETGRQMQIYITDSISGRLLDDYGIPYFAEDQFAEGLISLQDGVINKIKETVPVDWQSKQNVLEETEPKENNAVDGVLVEGNAENNVDVDANAATTEKSENDNSGKGILWGFFGSIIAAIGALIAFIRQKITGDKERKESEKYHQTEIASLSAEHEERLRQRDRLYEQRVADLTRNHQSAIQEKDDIISGLRQELRDAGGEIRTLTIERDSITDKFNRAKKLHPEYNFEDEICEMIESEHKATAKDIDRELVNPLATPADKDRIEFFSRALLLIDSAAPEVRQYITSDRKALKELYEESVRLKREFERLEQEKRDKAAADSAYNEIRGIYDSNPKGNYQTFEALNSALAIFMALTAAQKAFFRDDNLIESLKRVHRAAEIDHNDYTAASEAEESVRSIIGGMYSADEDDRDKLKRAKGYYNRLSVNQKDYFSDELLRKLNRLIEEAEDDYRTQERRRDAEEAARRRRMQQSSSSSFRSSSSRSSFGGHGGRPSGGGANRRF